MADMVDLHDHVEQLSDSDLKQYLKMAMREGDTARAAAADIEIQQRRES